jgi:SAM-dependent methyltransferase
MVDGLCAPISHIPDRTVWSFYRNIELEVQCGALTIPDNKALRAYYEEVGLLRRWRRPFFRKHCVEAFDRMCSFLLAGRKRPTIIDIGCGMGTQALYLASVGARVIALDRDERALGTLQRRRRLYERIAARSFDLRIVAGEAAECNYADCGQIDGVYSMFAFNMMQPSRGLLDRLLPALRSGARIAILDGNNDWLFQSCRRSHTRTALKPGALASIFDSHHIGIKHHRGAVAIPPVFWLADSAVLRWVDDRLTSDWRFSVSQLLLASAEPEKDCLCMASARASSVTD